MTTISCEKDYINGSTPESSMFIGFSIIHQPICMEIPKLYFSGLIHASPDLTKILRVSENGWSCVANMTIMLKEIVLKSSHGRVKC